MSFIVATNVVASRLPERRSTGMPHTCANYTYDRYLNTHFKSFLPTDNKIYEKLISIHDMTYMADMAEITAAEK